MTQRSNGLWAKATELLSGCLLVRLSCYKEIPGEVERKYSLCARTGFGSSMSVCFWYMVKPIFKVRNKTSHLISRGAERDCGEGRVYDARCWHPYSDQKDSYLLPPLNGSTTYQHDNLGTNLETLGNTQYFNYRIYGMGGLIRNKIKGLIIVLLLFGLVWSLAKGVLSGSSGYPTTYYWPGCPQFCRDSFPAVTSPCFQTPSLCNSIPVIWLLQHFPRCPLVHKERVQRWW